ncbi:hypothetical protein H0I23_06365 [Cellulophaga sp. HaHaR_3_176]|uniref:hypothetical protein n=1 Tax=Cellulophaga sp. HaHaR_3_176 TaxID=1942464 RepID=UPI001C1F3BEE|nr:hypothetical protein [Cellulophaga sp. HaHaR_3_176]QWX85258.1 hypothetical protein H0I23_06365 [Cellulophaga sp. HaHaR_3_176]
MGFNIAGLLIKGEADETEIEKFIGSKITFSTEVDMEKATSSYREENTIDILKTETGSLVITELGQVYDISNFDGEIIQFMISDVSDTYYFEKFSRGNLDRKYIYSQGEVAEDEGNGIIKEDDDMMDLIWELTDTYLQNDFLENMFDQKFKRYSF